MFMTRLVLVTLDLDKIRIKIDILNFYHKLHSAYIFTTSRLIFIN